ncbi:hypothetical protein IAI10_13935 [Clostridium sp. 19966]|uniref:hypothetical protein n=1 Tax=Clostridium sp. 19966 TaxID=2768166 RepID=UPI0028DD7F5A|nr:hypothetical protein [Clostridium sp. 19966]MDT8717764.1 hypothetical protein [Clostridium sp. 19966]
MEENKPQGVGGGIKTISVLYFIVAFFMILGDLILLGGKDFLESQYKSMGITMPSISDTAIAISLLLEVILVASLILILMKKAAGVYAYFAISIIDFIYSIISSGFSFTVLLGLILPILMAVFISKRKEVFGLGVKDENISSNSQV